MKTAMEHFSRGFDILSTIPVSGENVERMALAKQELRTGYALLEKAQKAAKDSEKKETAEVKSNG